MKNTTRIIAIALLVVMAAMMLASCGGGKDALVGKWETKIEGISATYEFTKDGKLIATAMGMTNTTEYKVNGDKLSVKEGSEWVEGPYRIEGDTLYVDEGTNQVVFKRVK